MGDMRNFASLAREAEKQSFVVKHDQACSESLLTLTSTARYRSYKQSNQTNTCAEKAARFYYNKLHPGLFLHDLEALDSHSFDRQHYDRRDNKAYYHVNFMARKATRANAPSMFFAELSGENGPDRVTTCTELEHPGLFHTRNNFVGFMTPNPPIQR